MEQVYNLKMIKTSRSEIRLYIKWQLIIVTWKDNICKY